jgi:hypothetical protein
MRWALTIDAVGLSRRWLALTIDGGEAAYPPNALKTDQYAFSCFSPWISVMKRIFRSSISDQFSM